jgi:hypothetical protein
MNRTVHGAGNCPQTAAREQPGSELIGWSKNRSLQGDRSGRWNARLIHALCLLNGQATRMTA